MWFEFTECTAWLWLSNKSHSLVYLARLLSKYGGEGYFHTSGISIFQCKVVGEMTWCKYVSRSLCIPLLKFMPLHWHKLKNSPSRRSQQEKVAAENSEKETTMWLVRKQEKWAIGSVLLFRNLLFKHLLMKEEWVGWQEGENQERFDQVELISPWKREERESLMNKRQLWSWAWTRWKQGQFARIQKNGEV